MPTDRSIREVAALKKLFSEASVVIATNYAGMSVAAMDALRAALRSEGVRYRVVKNTLARIAASEAGKPEIRELIDGPCGFVVTDGDAAAAAKAIVRHIRTARLELPIRGAAFDGQILDPERVGELAALPSRDELLARVLGQMNAPITGLVTVLSGPVRALATVLQRRIEQIDRGSETAGAEA